MKKVYDVVIVGAGPAGLFAALELSNNGIKDILIIDKGPSLDQRTPKDTMCGVGGSGTFSDGKLHFSLVLSHERLLDFMDPADAQALIDRVENDFLDFGVTAPATPTNMNEVNQLVKNCQRFNVRLFVRKCRHVGSDVLPGIMSNIVNKLTDNSVGFKCDTDVSKIAKDKSGGFILNTSAGEVRTEKILLAPGRIGTKWLQERAGELGIGYDYQKVEVGVRVEFPSTVMEDHSKIMYENIYQLQTPTFDDIMRSFCPCPNGYVAIEDYGDYVCVNGHSSSHNESPNSNFALVQEIRLTEPVENTTDYAISIAKLATTIGGGKPIVQRLTDLRKRRRSNADRIKKSSLIPTLFECTPGDISMALPYRLVTNLLEALEILDNVLPGINSGSNFLYAPEIKLRGSRIKTDKNLQTEIKGLFVAGDGAGVSGNIVGAAATGIIAARGILAK